MVFVAPTKKAASVVGREIGTTASSLPRVLMDYGLRWNSDPRTGRTTWSRLPEQPRQPGRAEIHRDGSLTLRAAGDSGDERTIDADYSSAAPSSSSGAW